MNNPLRSPEDYELLLYSISQAFPSIRKSTLTFVRRGASLARVSGELFLMMKFGWWFVNESYMTVCLQSLIGTDMKFGNVIKNCIGMTLSLSQMRQNCKAPTLITNIFLRT